MRTVDIQDLYNTFLRISRKRQNKPFKLRANFENFEENQNYPYLVKLKSFFERNYIVNIEDFFISPYEIYEDETFFGLDFYTTLNAVKAYNIFCSHKNNLDPDSEIQTESILRGLKFIKEFCIKNSIPLCDYLKHVQPGAVVPSFIVHLKEKNISLYNLFPFKNIEHAFSTVDFSTLKFILNDVAARISFFRTKFYSSKKGKLIATNGLKLIEKEINNNLIKNKNNIQ